MLILSRKQGQSLIIDKDITVTVLSIRNGQIRIGIEAPVAVSVLREELLAQPPRDAGLRPNRSTSTPKAEHAVGRRA